MPTEPFFRASQTSLFSSQSSRPPAEPYDVLAELELKDGRIFEMQCVNVTPVDGFTSVCLAEVEVREMALWFNRYFHVYVHWEELVEHEMAPDGESIAVIARREVADWLHNNRNWPDNSNCDYPKVIHFPPRQPLPYFP